MAYFGLLAFHASEWPIITTITITITITVVVVVSMELNNSSPRIFWPIAAFASPTGTERCTHRTLQAVVARDCLATLLCTATVMQH